MLAIILFLALVAIGVIVFTPLFWVVLGKLFKIDNLTFKKALITSLLLTLIGILLRLLPPGLLLINLYHELFHVLILILSFLVGVWILKLQFNTSVAKALGLHFSTVLLAVCLALAIKTFVIQAFRIPSGAMENSILVGDHILVNKYRYRFEDPAHGDIVVFKYPMDRSKNFIKRIVAVGGDTLEIRDKKVYVNGMPENTDFTTFADKRIFSNAGQSPGDFIRRDNLKPIEIPVGRLFVMGDNRDRSNDSRFWGFVDINDLQGKAFMVYWSWDNTNESIRWDRIGMEF